MRRLLQQSLATIERLERELAESRQRRVRREAIAVIGLGCRVPGASGPAEFWSLLASGRDAIEAIPADRWSADSLAPSYRGEPGRIASGQGGFVPYMREFDAEFFGIAPREALAHGPAAAAAARGQLGGARGRRPRRRRAARRADRRVRRHLCGNDYGTCQLQREPADASTRYLGTGTRAQRRRRPRRRTARAARARHGRRHGLLVVAGRGPPGLPEPARAASATWRSPAAST